VVGRVALNDYSAPSTDPRTCSKDLSIEHTRKDPKDGELCVHRVKPEEILVEARSDTTCKSFVKCAYSGERLIERPTMPSLGATRSALVDKLPRKVS